MTFQLLMIVVCVAFFLKTLSATHDLEFIMAFISVVRDSLNFLASLAAQDFELLMFLCNLDF